MYAKSWFNGIMFNVSIQNSKTYFKAYSMVTIDTKLAQ